MEIQYLDILQIYVDGIITGGTSGVTARVVGYADATTTDEPTLYVKYINNCNYKYCKCNWFCWCDNFAGVTNRFVNGESISVDKAISGGSINLVIYLQHY